MQIVSTSARSSTVYLDYPGQLKRRKKAIITVKNAPQNSEAFTGNSLNPAKNTTIRHLSRFHCYYARKQSLILFSAWLPIFFILELVWHRESNTRYRAKPGKSYGTEEIMDILFIVVTWKKKKRVEAFFTSICSFQQEAITQVKQGINTH